MDINSVLADWDKHASEFNFPVLDNAYVEFASARLTGFRGIHNWLIVFEILGFSTEEGQFVDDIYAFGSCVKPEGFIESDVILDEVHGSPLFDADTRQCIANWESWKVLIRGEPYTFSPPRGEYLRAGINVPMIGAPGSISEIQLLRFLVKKVGMGELFADDRELLGRFSACGPMSTLIQTTQWQHPDVAGEEKPSANRCIVSLLKAIDANNPVLFEPGKPNTDWRFWDVASNAG